MHIELTDHLRCPQPHEEGYLILLPAKMDGRRVVAGVLACPACDWQVEWHHSIPEFGVAWDAIGPAPLPVEGVPALLAIEGPGGWVALGGSAGRLAPELSSVLPGVALIAVNPPEGVEPSEAVSVIRGDVWAIKSHALRGVVLGEDAAHWGDAAAQSLLPGRQIIGVGRQPEGGNIELLAEMDSLWVSRRS